MQRRMRFTGGPMMVHLTLKAPIPTKVVCFSRLLKCLRSLYGKQCGPRSDCSYRSSLFWVMLFASILNSSVMLGNNLQQTTSADDIFRCIFFLGTLRVKWFSLSSLPSSIKKNKSEFDPIWQNFLDPRTMMTACDIVPWTKSYVFNLPQLIWGLPYS